MMNFVVCLLCDVWMRLSMIHELRGLDMYGNGHVHVMYVRTEHVHTEQVHLFYWACPCDDCMYWACPDGDVYCTAFSLILLSFLASSARILLVLVTEDTSSFKSWFWWRAYRKWEGLVGVAMVGGVVMVSVNSLLIWKGSRYQRSSAWLNLYYLIRAL